MSESFPPPSIPPPSSLADADDLAPLELGRGSRRMLAVGGGRGGAGKSLIAQNIAVYFAQLGKSVVLVDLDPTGANLHAQFGVPAGVHAPTDDGPDDLRRSLVVTSLPGLS